MFQGGDKNSIWMGNCECLEGGCIGIYRSWIYQITAFIS